MTDADLRFIEVATLMDNPEVRKRLLNTYFDEDFDAWADSDTGASLEEDETRHYKSQVVPNNIDLDDPNEWDEV